MKLFITKSQWIIKPVMAMALVGSITSCDKDFLNTSPVTSLSSASAFDTPDRILNQVYGIYASAKADQFYGGRYVIFQELRGDDFLMNKPNVQTAQLTWSQAVNSSTQEVTGLWSQCYAVINRANIFMAGLEVNKAKVSDDLYRNYVAESKFLRALSYFALVQQYARPYVENNGTSPGLPLRLQAEQSSANNSLERSTVAQVYDQIIKDLNDAEANLPLTYSTAVLNATRAHRNTAIALKARVYLAKGDYANVVTESAKIVSASAPFQATTGVANKLEPSIVTVFGGSYTGSEVLLTFPMNTIDHPAGQNALCYYFTFTPGNAEFFLNTNGIISDPVFASTSTDARKNLIITQQGSIWLYKFKVASTYADYVPVIRYAETLLNYAEAAARTGDLAKATSLLTAVRQRSSAGYAFPAASVSTQAALISTILRERRIELLGEGFRTPDLQRTLQPLPGKTAPSATSPSVAPTESKYVWPVSASELSNNPAAVPNP